MTFSFVLFLHDKPTTIQIIAVTYYTAYRSMRAWVN